MKKSYYIILILSSISSLRAQTIPDFFDSIEELNDVELYKILSNHENSKTKNYKNDFTHKIDSVVSFDFGNYNKTELIVEKNREIIPLFDKVENVWVKDAFVVFHYNIEDLLTEQTYSLWDDDIVDFEDNNPLLRRIFIYDQDGQLIELKSQTQNEIVNNVFGVSNIYTYNGSGSLISDSTYLWFYPEAQFRLLEVKKFIHNSEEKLTSIIQYDRDGIVSDSTSFIYDSDRLKFKHRIVSVDSSDYDYPRTTRELNTYEHDPEVLAENVYYGRNHFSGNIFDRSHYFENHMIKRVKKRALDQDLWWPTLETTNDAKLYYSENTTMSSNQNNELNPSLIFPNPASEFIHVKTTRANTNLDLYNTQGCLVLSRNIEPDQKIRVSQLPAGLYFYALTGSNGKSNGKILIER